MVHFNSVMTIIFLGAMSSLALAAPTIASADLIEARQAFDEGLLDSDATGVVAQECADANPLVCEALEEGVSRG